MIGSELRMEAAARMATIAGYNGTLDLHLVLARKDSIEILYRQALRAAIGDELLLDEVRGLLDIAKGRAVALDDAIHSSGLPEETHIQMTADDLTKAFEIARERNSVVH